MTKNVEMASKYVEMARKIPDNVAWLSLISMNWTYQRVKQNSLVFYLPFQNILLASSTIFVILLAAFETDSISMNWIYAICFKSCLINTELENLTKLESTAYIWLNMRMILQHLNIISAIKWINYNNLPSIYIICMCMQFQMYN